MKKNGFTLVEILAVIFILSLLAVIVTPVVTDLIKDSEQSLYDKQVNNIVNAVKKYGIEHSEVLPDKQENTILSLHTLLGAGILDKDTIINPKTKENMSGCVIISYSENYSQYEYNYYEECAEAGNVYTFEYTGSYQTFVAPVKGRYKLEVWGAQGGYRSDASMGGKGGYAAGSILLDAGDTLYVYVGGSGNSGVCTNSVCAGGYNGGGYRTLYKGGGGATDMRFLNSDNPLILQSLLSRVIVAGGGGSDGATNKVGGYGGGIRGGAPDSCCGTGGFGGTQTGFTTSNTVASSQYVTNGTNHAGFGFGGYGSTYQNNGWGGAGGGGWYGGVGTTADSGGSDDDRGGGGGSGFVYDSSSLSNLPSNYLVQSKYILSDSSLIAGNASMPNHEGSGNMTGNSGNGYAKITLVSLANGNIGYFDAVGREETFTASKSGYYELEVWGAQGGSVTGYRGGYGGYSDGVVYLEAGDTLYVNVGTQGASGNPTGKINGGYNGGGYVPSSSDGPTGRVVAGGGGATHIALSSGTLASFDSDEDGVADVDELGDILIVAGGGGGGYAHESSGYQGIGGDAGGATGVNGGYASGGCAGTGATQITGGNGCSTTGTYGKFGSGGNVANKSHGSAGGGGFYGGGGSKGAIMDNGNSGGGGGSGYIGNELLFGGLMYCYGCTPNNNDGTVTISTTGSDSSLDSVNCVNGYNSTAYSKCAKAGGGYAKIRYLGFSF